MLDLSNLLPCFGKNKRWFTGLGRVRITLDVFPTGYSTTHSLDSLASDHLDMEETDPKGKPDLRVELSEVTTLSKMRKPEFYTQMMNNAVAGSSYVALCLGDCLTALHKAEQLLMQPDLSGSHKWEPPHRFFTFHPLGFHYLSSVRLNWASSALSISHMSFIVHQLFSF